MQKNLDLANFETARLSVLSLLYQDNYYVGGDGKKDFGHVKAIYDQAHTEIINHTDGDEQSQLLYLLHIVIAELLFKHFGYLIVNGYITRMSDSMEQLLKTFEISPERVINATDAPSMAVAHEPLILFIHLNSRILHNLAILIGEHNHPQACSVFISKWSKEYAQTITSSHILTHTIAKNIMALLTPDALQLIQSKAEISIKDPFPKLYFCSEFKEIATESLLTHIIKSSPNDPTTFDRRLAHEYQELTLPKDQITMQDIESLLALEPKVVPRWAIDKRKEIFTRYIQLLDAMKPAERTRFIRKLMRDESQLNILFSTPKEKLQKNGGKPVSPILSFFCKPTQEMQKIREKHDEAVKLIYMADDFVIINPE